MTKGAKSPKGSKILAVMRRTNRFVTGKLVAYCTSSLKQKLSSSLWIFQATPSILDSGSVPVGNVCAIGESLSLPCSN